LKTNKDPIAPTSTHSSEQAATELNTLMQRPRVYHAAHIPQKVDGIALGKLSAFAENGDALVDIENFGLQKIAAHTLIELNHSHIAQQVALGFQAGDPYRPTILGLLHQPAPVTNAVDDTPAQQELVVTQQGKRIIIEAEQELELRCGEAVILLTADGHIQLRGGYITSHADATQRIRGGSVQIN